MKSFKSIFKGLITLLLLTIAMQLTAQDSCVYRLRLYDRYGDGWDDSQLYIKLGNNAERAFTHDGAAGVESDSIRLYDIRVKNGDTLIVRYDPQGSYQGEIKYTLFNNAGDPILLQGPTPQSGVVFRSSIKCVSCGLPINLTVASVRTFTTTIKWNPSVVGTQPTYRIEWGETNFTPGTSRNAGTTTDTFAILPGLKEITRYFVYVRTTCGGPATDTSKWVGPVSFVTDTAINVGISAIVSPIGRCDLGIDSVKVKIKNYGGAPASLIPFKYSVNGVNAPVQMPQDGLYTGVISKDSTATIAFKAVSDFSAPGEYNIAAWTELEGDKNNRNDTFRITIVRPRLINQFPYQQDFEAGKDTWQKVDSIGKSTWEWATPRYRFIQGAASGNKAWTTAADTSYRNSDTSYLLSPCFDFSSFNTDPRISFALNFYSEPRFDGTWLEGSTDGGKTWTKIGKRNTGINWYNDTLSRTDFELWTGTTRLGWHVAQNTLTGMKGQAQCRLRFVFRADNSTNINFDGVAIDNIIVSNAAVTDLALDSVGRVDISDCGSVKDTVSLRIFNLGNTAQASYSVGFRVDNNAPVTETVTNFNIPAGQSAVYKFKAPLNSLATAGTHTLKAWVNLAADNIRVNDTAMTTFFITPATKGNTVFNFDDLIAPQYWTAIRAGLARGRHGNAASNGYLFANIYTDTAVVDGDTIITPNAQLFDVTTNKFGPVRVDDSLKYDYRFVNEDNPFGGYDLITKDTLKVMVSADCSPNWVVIDVVTKQNHTPTALYRSRSVSLKQFVGQTLKVRFQVTSAIDTFTGYFIDIDNVNFKSICPTDFGIQSTVKKSDRGLANGQIKVKPTRGAAPFIYKWNNNATIDSIANLAIGDYTVTITDANGCTDVQTFKIDFVSSTFEAASAISKVTLSPNPTSGNALLDVEFRKILDARVQVYNMMGQLMTEQRSKQTDKAQFELDLSNRPAGVYLVRITADNKTHTARLVKQ